MCVNCFKGAKEVIDNNPDAAKAYAEGDKRVAYKFLQLLEHATQDEYIETMFIICMVFVANPTAMRQLEQIMGLAADQFFQAKATIVRRKGLMMGAEAIDAEVVSTDDIDKTVTDLLKQGIVVSPEPEKKQ